VGGGGTPLMSRVRAACSLREERGGGRPWGGRGGSGATLACNNLQHTATMGHSLQEQWRPPLVPRAPAACESLCSGGPKQGCGLPTPLPSVPLCVLPGGCLPPWPPGPPGPLAPAPRPPTCPAAARAARARARSSAPPAPPPHSTHAPAAPAPRGRGGGGAHWGRLGAGASRPVTCEDTMSPTGWVIWVEELKGFQVFDGF
jgi:hypothetical protein